MKLLIILFILFNIFSYIICETDYYKILDISRDADEKTIKKAYRKLALKYHPDKNPENQEEAEQKFMEISNAYEVLMDPEKKAIYDQWGEEGLKGGGSPGGPGGNPFGGGFQFHSNGGGGGNFQDPFDIFEEVFGSGFFGKSGGNGGSFSFGGGGGGPGMGGFNMGGMPGMGGMGGKGGQQKRSKQKNLYPNDSPVYTLSTKKFPDHKAKYIWLVQFYGYDCCGQFASNIEKLATKLKDIVKVGSVNCEKYSALCNKWMIQDFPRFKLIMGQDKIDFNEDLSMKKLYDFVEENLPQDKVTNLVRSSHIDNFLNNDCKKKSYKLCLILFTSRFDTSGFMKSLTYTYDKNIAIGEVRGSNKALSERFNIKEYPTILLICNGDEKYGEKIYDNKIDMREIHKYLDTFSDSKICKNIINENKKIIENKKKTILSINQDFSKMKTSELKKKLYDIGETCAGCFEKNDFINRLNELVHQNK